MKKVFIKLIAVIVCTGLTSCTGNLTEKKVETMIKSHPFLKEISVAITNIYLSGHDNDLLGKKENGYIGLHDMTTAYYYRKHGFKLVKVKDLIVDRENNTATCKIILAPDGITEALNELHKRSSYYTPDISVNGETFTVAFHKYKGKGWNIANLRHSSNDSFKINGWRNGQFIYNITPNSYNEKGEIPVKTYSY
jgi:hypothetical protein